VDLFLAIVKLCIALPVLAGVGILMVAILNLMYDPGAVDEPGAMGKQEVPLAKPVLFALLMFLLFAPFAMPWLQAQFWPELSEPDMPLVTTAIALVIAAFVLGVLSKSWPRALPISWRRQPIMAYCLFAPVLALVAIINRIIVEDIGGGELPMQVLAGSDQLNGWPLAGALLLIIVLVPWLEEILFRHYLWGALVKHPGFGPARALVFTSLAFTVLHPPTVWLPIFFLGMFLAWVRWRSSRLADAVVIHQVHNLVVVWLLTDLL
jgi:membrane protease YdiL (CAAX protease family)